MKRQISTSNSVIPGNGLFSTMHLPEIHIVESNGQSLGLCAERPILIRMSEVTKAILRLHPSDNTDDNINLQTLLRQYEQPDIQKALDELTNLEKKSRQSLNAHNGSSGRPQILSIEVLSGSTQELGVIKRASSFLLQGIGAGEVGTIILDLHCSLSRHFYETVWKFGANLARKQSKHLRMVLKISLLSLDGEIVSAVKTTPVGIQFVVTAEQSSTVLPISVKTHLERLLLRTYAIGALEKSNESQVLDNLQTLARTGISIVHRGAGKCGFTHIPLESNICAACSNDLPTYFAPSESLKYLALLTTSMPAQYHCGAGRWYWAVSSSGKIYPCHRFIGDDRFLAGHIHDTSLDTKVSSQFEGVPVSKKVACQKCWARHLCGGGCAYDAVCHGEPLNGIDASACANIKNNVEQAAVLFAGMNDASKTMTGKLIDMMATVLPYWQDSPMHETGTTTLVSNGNSMYPLIQDGATLTLLYTHPRKIRMGDIFSYKKDQKIITHRVIGKIVRDGKVFFLEKGDNAFFAETTGAELFGRVILLKNPGMNKPLRLDTPLWRLGDILIVVMVVTLWLTYFISRTGGVLVIQIIKQRFSMRKAIAATVMKTSLHHKSRWLLIITNRMTQYITRLLFFIHMEGKEYGNLQPPHTRTLSIQDEG